MKLEQLVLRELSEAESSAIGDHVSACDQCAQVIANLHENQRLEPSLRQEATGGPDEAAADNQHASIAGYRILRLLGRGGMGTVYEAEQDNPRRVVALKMIRPGLVSASLLARFRQEAQTLGRLQHPGIAQIHEAGTQHINGVRQPYFVMEYVRGSTLLKYANANLLDTRQRLELMAKICDAVQHAHQRGVIHRDLKPDNILVDDTGSAPQPKVLDFGVARVIDPEGRTTTLHTSVGQIVGTVAYMSPEQASARPDEIDVRADVYALGVICYELMSGRLPYSINQMSVAESVRTIVQDDPTPLASVVRSLRGDVTTIVGKALEKEKPRRYQSAADLAADLRRFLRDEPVAAHPPSTVYQLSKFARRNKGLVGGVVATIIVLTLGVIGTSVQMVRAQLARDLARNEAEKGNAVNEFLNDMLGSANPRELTMSEFAKGRDVTVVQVLDDAGRKLDAGSLKDQPHIEARIRRTLGQTYGILGEHATAEPHLQRALALTKQLVGASHLQVAEDMVNLGMLRHMQGKDAQAESLHREALAMRRQLVGEQSREVAESLNNLGVSLHELGKYEEAESVLRKSLEVRQNLGADDALAPTMNYLAMVLRSRGQYDGAEELLRRALVIRRRLLGEQHPDVATNLNDLASLLYSQRKLEEAEPLYREALAISRKMWGEEHPLVASTLNGLGALLYQQRKLEDAESMLRRSIEIDRKLLGEEHPRLADKLSNLAMVLSERGKLADAETMLRKNVEIRRKSLGAEHPDVATAVNNLAGILKEQGKLSEAEPLFREALEMRRRTLGDDHPNVATSMYNLAAVQTSQGKAAEAEPLFRKALEMVARQMGPAHVHTATMRAGLGGCLVELRRYEEAEPELLEAHKVFRSSLGVQDRRTVGTIRRLVSVYEALGKPNQAREMLALLPATQPASTQSATGPPRTPAR